MADARTVDSDTAAKIAAELVQNNHLAGTQLHILAETYLVKLFGGKPDKIIPPSK